MEKQSTFELFKKHKIEGLQQIVGGFMDTTVVASGRGDRGYYENEPISQEKAAKSKWDVFTNTNGGNPQNIDVVASIAPAPGPYPEDDDQWTSLSEGEEYVVN